LPLLSSKLRLLFTGPQAVKYSIYHWYQCQSFKRYFPAKPKQTLSKKNNMLWISHLFTHWKDCMFCTCCTSTGKGLSPRVCILRQLSEPNMKKVCFTLISNTLCTSHCYNTKSRKSHENKKENTVSCFCFNNLCLSFILVQHYISRAILTWNVYQVRTIGQECSHDENF
jgi:hypothetical protein